MTKFAILRTAKLKTIGNIAGSGSHNFRERVTPNADTNRTPQNQHIGAKNTAELIQAVKNRLPENLRKGAVLCLEYIVTASPEKMAAMSRKEQNQYFSDALIWLRKKHGSENVVSASIHRDETTPHLCVYVVPLVEQLKRKPRGKERTTTETETVLNAKHFVGSRKKLADMQTDFVDQVGKIHGMERGVKGSKAHHKDLKKWYGENAQARAALPAMDFKKLPLTEMVLVPEPVLNSLAAKAGALDENRAAVTDLKRKLSRAERSADEKAEAVIQEVKSKASQKGLDLLKAEKELKFAHEKIRGLEPMAKQLKDLSAAQAELVKTTANLLKGLPPAQLAKLVGVELKGKADVFEAMVKAGKAEGFADAVTKVAVAYNSATNTKISDSARWVQQYNEGEQDRPKG